ncbi:hypothetical protein [Nocardia sp. NPDC056100]|uniref:hypothetical protein n=1 Tax=Nocardia sp. NPDC056100 TaxID=3345712 RepID=UPI0035DE9840
MITVPDPDTCARRHPETRSGHPIMTTASCEDEPSIERPDVHSATTPAAELAAAHVTRSIQTHRDRIESDVLAKHPRATQRFPQSPIRHRSVRELLPESGRRTVTKAVSAAFQLAMAAGLHSQLGTIAMSSRFPDAVACGATINLLVLVAAAVAMAVSAVRGHQGHRPAARSAWDLSLLLQTAGAVSLWVTLVCAGTT